MGTMVLKKRANEYWVDSDMGDYVRQEANTKPCHNSADYHYPEARRQCLYSTANGKDTCSYEERAPSPQGVSDATGSDRGNCSLVRYYRVWPGEVTY